MATRSDYCRRESEVGKRENWLSKGLLEITSSMSDTHIMPEIVLIGCRELHGVLLLDQYTRISFLICGSGLGRVSQISAGVQLVIQVWNIIYYILVKHTSRSVHLPPRCNIFA